MPSITTFDTTARYIFLPIFVIGPDGKPREFDAILDTGAPSTEFSDTALEYAGFLSEARKNVSLKPGLQTQKYGKIVIPKVEICSHPIANLEVYVSHFEKSWGVDALIGLDFLRRFRITVDYKKGEILTEPIS